MISAVDLLPTMLDIAGIEHPASLEGRSLLPLLRGQTQEGRDYIVGEYNENSGGHRHPMRSIVTREFGYIFNPWSNGERVMATATTGTVAYRRMKELAKGDDKIAARLKLFENRVPEELYHYASDPDALVNLIDKPEYRQQQQRLAKLLEAWMVKTADPMLEVFRGRNDAGVREAYMAKVEQEAAERGPRRKRAAGEAPMRRRARQLPAKSPE
jgi:N-sulfoglucosamine sulfohydrolase